MQQSLVEEYEALGSTLILGLCEYPESMSCHPVLCGHGTCCGKLSLDVLQLRL